MSKKKRIIILSVAICVALIFLSPILLRGILYFKANMDHSSDMITGEIVEDVTEGHGIIIDFGNPDYDLEINTNGIICFNRLGFPCSKDNLTKGKNITFYSKSSVVYDITNYEEQENKRVDFVHECWIVWINH